MNAETYRVESQHLDAALLEDVARWQATRQGFDDAAFEKRALDLFAYQLRYNAPYARYCASLGVTLDRLPRSWETIPAIPSAALKASAVATFDPSRAALVFRTSGTTQTNTGYHYMENAALYRAVSLAGFDAFMLPDAARLRYLHLVPNPAEHPHSSLGYMMAHVAAERGDGATRWLLRENVLLADDFIEELEAASALDRAVCIATTAFGLVHALDALDDRNLRFALPAGSRLMETGGFKGRSRYVDRRELYVRAADRFGIDTRAIVAEYGMTELTSQYYDDVLLRKEGTETRYKAAPPWLRARVAGPDGRTLPRGTVGAIVHVDLANRSSCLAIATEDIGVQFDEGLVVMGRETGAPLRGCSLSAEDLVRR